MGQAARRRAHRRSLAVEPHAAEALFRDFVREANAPVLYEAPLEAAHKQGARITAIEAGGHTIEARMFIDATYEGDLMAAAGVRYTLMREANSTIRRDAQWRNVQPAL
ncbi:MAG: FAD-dependent oxidoreductase [Bryobacterales bacterium]